MSFWSRNGCNWVLQMYTIAIEIKRSVNFGTIFGMRCLCFITHFSNSLIIHVFIMKFIPFLKFWITIYSSIDKEADFNGRVKCILYFLHRALRYNWKIKWSRYRPSVAQWVGRGIALLFHDCGTRSGCVVSRTPRPHFTPGKTMYPFYREMSGPQGRSGRAENLVPTGIRSRSVQPSVSSYTVWASRLTYFIQLCNVNQQNAHCSIECFNSILVVFHIFQILCVHH